MKSRNVAWTLAGCTVAATSTGLFVPEPSLAVGSVVLGGCALVAALQTYVKTARQRINEKMLESLR